MQERKAVKQHLASETGEPVCTASKALGLGPDYYLGCDLAEFHTGLHYDRADGVSWTADDENERPS